MNLRRRQLGFIGGGIIAHNHTSNSQGGTQLPSHVPAGTIADFGHANDPGGNVGDWLERNGQNVSRTTYATLFAKVGTTWGVGDGVTTFGVGDSRRRTKVGMGGAGTGILANTVGSTGGAETTEAHTHTAGSISFTAGDGSGGAGGPAIEVQSVTRDTIGNNSSGANNYSPTHSGTSGSFGTGANGNFQPSYICGVWIKT